MAIKSAFIKCAGLGTRMREISNYLPKCMAPIFETTLLDINLLQLKGLGIENVWINLHHKADQLCGYAEAAAKKHSLSLNFSYEDPLLDSGGCLNALKSKGVNEKILVLNGDSFVHFTGLVNILSRSEDGHILFGKKVKPTDNYNRLLSSDDGHFQGISKEKSASSITFSGVSLIDLRLISKDLSPKGFFHLLSSSSESIKIKTPEKTEFWDFGDPENYYKSLVKIMKRRSKQGSHLISLLLENRFLDLQKCSEEDSYACKGEGSFNFSGKELLGEYYKSIILENSLSKRSCNQEVLIGESVFPLRPQA